MVSVWPDEGHLLEGVEEVARARLELRSSDGLPEAKDLVGLLVDDPRDRTGRVAEELLDPGLVEDDATHPTGLA